MQQENLLEQLYAQIEVELEFCDGDVLPTVCGMNSNPDGRAGLVKLIAETALSQKLTIAQAIAQVERLYSINSLD